MEEAVIESQGSLQRWEGGDEGKSMEVCKFKVSREKGREKLVGSDANC